LAGSRLVHCGQRFGRQLSARLKLRDRNRKTVSSSWHGLDDFLVGIGDGLTHFADASRERIVGHDHVWPGRFDQLVFGHQAPGIPNKVAQYLEALGTQVDLAISSPQTALYHIQCILRTGT
jgi:hypothetical protein